MYLTYLELVNNVLRRLREPEVASVNESEYSLLVGDYINDAKTIVENAYQWAGLRQDVTVTTVAGTRGYSLTGVPSRSKIMDVWNVSDDREITYKEKKYFRRNEINPASGSPMYYTYDGLSSIGEVQILLSPTPDAAIDIDVSVVAPLERMTANGDQLKVPYTPVLHLALALLARERGETGGTSTAELFQISERFLKDAIAIEAARHEEELIYYTV